VNTQSNPGGGLAKGGSAAIAWVHNATAGATTISPIAATYSGFSNAEASFIEFAQGTIVSTFVPQVGAFLVGF
jgi:hypothetical protein